MRSTILLNFVNQGKNGKANFWATDSLEKSSQNIAYLSYKKYTHLVVMSGVELRRTR